MDAISDDCAKDSDDVGLDFPPLYHGNPFSYAVNEVAIASSHRQVYVGLHHRPSPGKPLKRPPKLLANGPPKFFRWENGKKRRMLPEDSASDSENQGDTTITAPASERVKFIIGGDQSSNGGSAENKEMQQNPQLFTELEELFVYVDGNAEWKETARWYKYEEDVEEGGDRWSKPHVATLSLYSLLELRSSLMAGTVILDLDATSLPDIASNVLDNLVSCNKLDASVRERVEETLLRRHNHQRSIGFRRNLSNIMSRNKSCNSMASKLNEQSCTSLKSAASMQNGTTTKPPFARHISQPNGAPNPQGKLFQRNLSVPGHLVYAPSNNTDTAEEYEKESHSLRNRLPSNAEASNILVGEVDFLDRPITAFVRLFNSSVIRDLTEVSIPTRFVFIMLGPSLTTGRYHEIGRAISTLMSDDVFHDVAYRAKSREDLIAGIDEFLEQVTVLPPGEWDPSIRIKPPVNGNAKITRRLPAETTKVEYHQADNQHGSGTSVNSDSEDDRSQHGILERQQFGGLVADLQRYRGRVRDLKDGFSVEAVSGVLFMYLLVLSFVFTFGEHEQSATQGVIGTSEHMLAFGIIGVVFALFGGQPMLTICYTVPVLMFDKLLYIVSQNFNFDFLPFRFWVGMWTALILFISIIFNLSNIVQYLTRFSLEVFAVLQPFVFFGFALYHVGKLVCGIIAQPAMFANQSCFCVESAVVQNITAVANTAGNFTVVKNVTANATLAVSRVAISNTGFRECLDKGWQLVGDGCHQGVEILTLLIILSTCLLVLFMVSFQHIGCFPSLAQKFLHTFASSITVCIVSIAVNHFPINMPYLDIPATFARSVWFVPAFGANPGWTVACAIIPALFLAPLVFCEQQVTAFYLNIKNKHLKKATGYHLDLLIVTLGVVVSSVLGLPMCVASLPLSLNHVNMLTVLQQRQQHFYAKQKIVREQRVTGLLVSVLLLLTPLLGPVLRYIPVAALYGVLIMAMLRILSAVELIKRVKMSLMNKSHQRQDEEAWLRQVPLISVNIVTVAQICCIVVLWIVRATLAAVVFPVTMVLVALLRVFIERILPERDMLLLDGHRPEFSWVRKKTTSESDLIRNLQSEQTTTENQEQFENRKVVEGVRVCEELCKTAAWQHLVHEENNHHGNDDVDHKRRKKRERESTQDNGKNRELLETNTYAKPVETNNMLLNAFEEEIVNNSPVELSVKKHHHKQRHRGNAKHKERRTSEDRSHRKHSTSSKSSKRTKDSIVEETPLPPWEQPYHSPPRKDFGLLKIPEDDLSVDPACSRTESAERSDNTPSNQSPFSSPELSSTKNYNQPPVDSRDASAEEDVL